MNRFVRAGLGLMVPVMFLMGGCRTATADRMRVLEAQLNQQERRADQLQLKYQQERNRTIEAHGQLESTRALLAAAQTRPAPVERATERAPESQPGLDFDDLKDRLDGDASVRRDGRGGATITLASDVTFRPGKADLNKDALSRLQRVATAIQETSGFDRVRVEGHTDSDPIRRSGWKSNEELSLARAEKVRRFLVAQGVENSRLTVDGFGAARPVAENSTKGGKARNRRVEIVLQTR